MSEIYGTGYGSAHDWRRRSRALAPEHEYRCERCGEHFVHRHIEVPNIWSAIKRAGVAEACARPDLRASIGRK